MSSELSSPKSQIYQRRGKEPVHAVRDCGSLTVKPGEINALLGSSGCGKTSTLRMIAGFEETTGGAITLDAFRFTVGPPGAPERCDGPRGLFALSAGDHRENIAFP